MSRPFPRTIAAVTACLLAPAVVLTAAPTAQALDLFPRDYATYHRVEVNTPGTGADELTRDASGNVWYADDAAGEIVKVDATTSSQTAFPLGLGRIRTVSLAVTPDGSVWFGDADSEVLHRLNTTTGTVDTFPLAGRFPGAPTSIAVDAAGNIWFGGWNGASDPGLTMMRPDGTSVRVDSPTGHMIEQVTVVPDGRIWFTEDATPDLGVYDPVSGIYSRVSMGPLSTGAVADVEVSAHGEIWAATIAGVAKIAPGGTIITSAPFAPRALPITPGSMTAGEAAEMYFTDGEGGMVFIDALGEVTEIHEPFTGTSVSTLTVDAHGSLWFALDGDDHLGWV